MAESIRYDELTNGSGSYSEMESKRQEIQSTFSASMQNRGGWRVSKVTLVA